MAKATLMIICQDILEASGSAQLCAAVHAVSSLFCDELLTEILLVDPSNVFNSLNRITALHTMHMYYTLALFLPH